MMGVFIQFCGNTLGSLAYMLPVATEPNIYPGLQESAGRRDSAARACRQAAQVLRQQIQTTRPPPAAPVSERDQKLRGGVWTDRRRRHRTGRAPLSPQGRQLAFRPRPGPGKQALRSEHSPHLTAPPAVTGTVGQEPRENTGRKTMKPRKRIICSRGTRETVRL